jgi:WD40 repeat protein
MKTKLLFKMYTAIFVCGLSFMSLNAQTVTCYDATAASAPDFWLSNFYFSKCTDYLNTGGKDITNSDYVDFDGGGTVVFDNVYVSNDADYTCRLTYGIGYADAVTGCDFLLIVNEAYMGKFTVFGPHTAGTTIDLPLPLGTLFADWNNVIIIQQARHWPTTLGIQLLKGLTAVPVIKEYPFNISGLNKSIQISNLTNEKNSIEIYSVEGRLINSEIALGSSFVKCLNQGIYLVKVNGTPVKVIVQ